MLYSFLLILKSDLCWLHFAPSFHNTSTPTVLRRLLGHSAPL